MATIFGMLKKRAAAPLRAVHARLLRWTKPATRTPVRGALADVTMSKAALVAENALLRQQLIVLQRQVTRPAFMPRDRVVLVLLARLVRGWQAALLIVQPETLLRWHRQGYLCWLPSPSRTVFVSDGTCGRSHICGPMSCLARRLFLHDKLRSSATPPAVSSTSVRR